MRRIVLQYVSVVIAQAIMRHKIGREGKGEGGCGVGVIEKSFSSGPFL